MQFIRYRIRIFLFSLIFCAALFCVGIDKVVAACDTSWVNNLVGWKVWVYNVGDCSANAYGPEIQQKVLNAADCRGYLNVNLSGVVPINRYASTYAVGQLFTKDGLVEIRGVRNDNFTGNCEMTNKSNSGAIPITGGQVTFTLRYGDDYNVWPPTNNLNQIAWTRGAYVQVDSATFVPSVCNNGVIDPGEDCDPVNYNSGSCPLDNNKVCGANCLCVYPNCTSDADCSPATRKVCESNPDGSKKFVTYQDGKCVQGTCQNNIKISETQCGEGDWTSPVEYRCDPENSYLVQRKWDPYSCDIALGCITLPAVWKYWNPSTQAVVLPEDAEIEASCKPLYDGIDTGRNRCSAGGNIEKEVGYSICQPNDVPSSSYYYCLQPNDDNTDLLKKEWVGVKQCDIGMYMDPQLKCATNHYNPYGQVYTGINKYCYEPQGMEGRCKSARLYSSSCRDFAEDCPSSPSDAYYICDWVELYSETLGRWVVSPLPDGGCKLDTKGICSPGTVPKCYCSATCKQDNIEEHAGDCRDCPNIFTENMRCGTGPVCSYYYGCDLNTLQPTNHVDRCSGSVYGVQKQIQQKKCQAGSGTADATCALGETKWITTTPCDEGCVSTGEQRCGEDDNGKPVVEEKYVCHECVEYSAQSANCQETEEWRVVKTCADRYNQMSQCNNTSIVQWTEKSVGKCSEDSFNKTARCTAESPQIINTTVIANCASTQSPCCMTRACSGAEWVTAQENIPSDSLLAACYISQCYGSCQPGASQSCGSCGGDQTCLPGVCQFGPCTKSTGCSNNQTCDCTSNAGSDLCLTNTDCVSGLKHKKCDNQQCIEVNGFGVDGCSNNADCSSDTHNKCNNQQCVKLTGAGISECSVDADCANISGTHNECRNQMCVQVDGAGQDVCQTDADCVFSSSVILNCEDAYCVGQNGEGQALFEWNYINP